MNLPLETAGRGEMQAGRTWRFQNHPFGLAAVSAILMFGSYALRLSLLHTRTFDPDEFQHLHAAWVVNQGFLPFRDYFDHHMPGLQYLLAWMLGTFDVTASAEDAIRFLFFARTLMWIFAGCSVALTVLLGMRHGGASVGWMSGALLSMSIVFVGRTLEIRPDTPGLMFWLASLVALTIAVQPARAGDRSLMWFIGSGFCFGCGLLFNQKLLLAAPGLVVWAALYLRHRPGAPGLKSKLLDLTSFAGASAVPLLVLVTYFWWQGATTDLVRGVLTNNLGWPQEVSAGSTVRWMLLRDPLLCAVSVAGLLQASFSMARNGSPSLALLLFPTVSLLAGLALIPTPYPQYMLLVLPAAAVLGAHFIWTFVSHLPTSGRLVRGGRAIESLMVAASCVAVSAVGLNVARPFYLHPAVYPVFGATAIMATAVLAWRRRPEWAAPVLLCAFSVYGAQQLRWMQGLSNADALRQMRYVHSITKPTDRVLDGFTGFAWFRPHASFYPFLHPGVRRRLTHQETAKVATMLADCNQRPKLVILDNDLRELSPAVAPLVLRYYQPSPFALIWIRNDDWRVCSNAPSVAR